MPVLEPSDRTLLSAFFERALELHADGVASAESVLEHLMLIVGTIDQQDRGELNTLRSVLAEAWRHDNG